MGKPSSLEPWALTSDTGADSSLTLWSARPCRGDAPALHRVPSDRGPARQWKTG